MTQKELGYVELEWTCPNCKTRNKGTVKMCTACGAAQPADVQFEQAQTQELVTDQEKIEIAKKGPDIHCPYCGARNLADAPVCIQCGGDLKTGLRREVGKVIGAYTPQTGPIKDIPCPNCGTLNPETSQTCKACGANMHMEAPQPLPAAPVTAAKPANKWLGIAIAGGAGLLVLLCLFFFVSTLTKRENLSGTVANTSWVRMINVEELRDVSREAFREDIPSGAVVGACQEKYHHTQPQPPTGGEASEEVCGTPYTKDTGSGMGQVVQDCEYKVSLDYCRYTVKEWQVVNKLEQSGSDLNPQWPVLHMAQNQRQGSQEQSYKIVFQTPNGELTYTTNDETTFRQFTPGSEWDLTLNGFGSIVDIEPR